MDYRALNIEIPDAIDFDLISNLENHVNNKLFPADPVKDISQTAVRDGFLALLEWAKANPDIVPEKVNIAWFNHVASLDPNRLMMWDGGQFDEVDTFVKSYRNWHLSQVTDTLFKMNLVDMTGYQFKFYLQSLGIVTHQ